MERSSGWHEKRAQQESIRTTIFVIILMTWTTPSQTHLYNTPQFTEHLRPPRVQDIHSLSFVSTLEADDVATAPAAIYSAFVYSFIRTIP